MSLALSAPWQPVNGRTAALRPGAEASDKPLMAPGCASGHHRLKERIAVKKKARPRGDAPSNKTFGNCMLGFHCSQNTLCACSLLARWRVVAGCQQALLSTSYQQFDCVCAANLQAPSHCAPKTLEMLGGRLSLYRQHITIRSFGQTSKQSPTPNFFSPGTWANSPEAKTGASYPTMQKDPLK